MSGPQKYDKRGAKEERYAVSFSVSLTWEEKSGLVRRINGRCIDLSPEGIKVEARERVESGTMVLVTCDEFGRMGLATVRYSRRDKINCMLGLRFGAAFSVSDPARRKILAGVLQRETADPPTP